MNKSNLPKDDWNKICSFCGQFPCVKSTNGCREKWEIEFDKEFPAFSNSLDEVLPEIKIFIDQLLQTTRREAIESVLLEGAKMASGCKDNKIHWGIEQFYNAIIQTAREKWDIVIE